jgi:hypothetical protein
VLAIPAETRLDVNINSRLFADDSVPLSALFQKNPGRTLIEDDLVAVQQAAPEERACCVDDGN